MALSFTLGPLAPGQIARFELLISEDGDLLGDFALRHLDANPASTTIVTYSGRAMLLPEPGIVLLLGTGLAGLALRCRRPTERRTH